VPTEISPAQDLTIPMPEAPLQPPSEPRMVNEVPAVPATPVIPEVDQEVPGRPKRIKKPSKYVQRLQEGEGVADDRPSREAPDRAVPPPRRAMHDPPPVDALRDPGPCTRAAYHAFPMLDLITPAPDHLRQLGAPG
jgi:hypothetical protein